MVVIIPNLSPLSDKNEHATTWRPDIRLMTEKPYRSLVKAISWRVTGTMDTVVISFLITGQAKWALTIGLVELFTKIFLYYAHERIWNNIPFGRPKPPEFEI